MKNKALSLLLALALLAGVISAGLGSFVAYADVDISQYYGTVFDHTDDFGSRALAQPQYNSYDLSTSDTVKVAVVIRRIEKFDRKDVGWMVVGTGVKPKDRNYAALATKVYLNGVEGTIDMNTYALSSDGLTFQAEYTFSLSSYKESQQLSIHVDSLYAVVSNASLNATAIVDGSIQISCSHLNGCTQLTEHKDVTCTQDGYDEYVCTRCDKVWRENEVEKLGHLPVTDPAREATCFQTGLTEGKMCSICEKVLVEQETVEKLRPQTETEEQHQPDTASPKTEETNENVFARIIKWIIENIILKFFDLFK